MLKVLDQSKKGFFEAINTGELKIRNLAPIWQCCSRKSHMTERF
jgi:hypothetical protein